MSSKNPHRKIKKSYLILLGLLVAVAVLLRAFQFHYGEATLLLKGEEIQVMVAKSPKQWHRGLGKRDGLGKYDGMIFPFPFSERHAMVMRDMRFPIDIVWIAEGKVVDIAPDVPVYPQDRPYIPREENTVVVELKAGWVREHGLKIGDTLEVVKE